MFHSARDLSYPLLLPPFFLLCSGSVLHAEAWAAGPEPLLINFSVKTSSEAGRRMQPALSDITGFDTCVISNNAKGLHQTRVKTHKRDGAKFEPLFVSRQPRPMKNKQEKKYIAGDTWHWMLNCHSAPAIHFENAEVGCHVLCYLPLSDKTALYTVHWPLMNTYCPNTSASSNSPLRCPWKTGLEIKPRVCVTFPPRKRGKLLQKTQTLKVMWRILRGFLSPHIST